MGSPVGWFRDLAETRVNFMLDFIKYKGNVLGRERVHTKQL